MNEKKILISMIIIGLLLTTQVLGQSFSKVGQAGASFLKIEVGSRGVAMGGAQVAAVDDASAIFWNPAALGFLRYNSFHFSYNQWIADLSHNFFGVALPLSIGTVGVALTSLSYGEMEETTIAEPDGTGNMFSANDFAISVSYAKQLTDRFTTGVTFKYVREKIWDMSASGICFDVGTIFKTPFKGISFGMVITNFGQNLSFDGQQLIKKDKMYNNITVTSRYETESFQVPIAFKLGIVYKVIQSETNNLIIAMDGVHPNDNLEYLNLGAEYFWSNIIALRAGYKVNTDIQGISAGAGFNLRLGNLTTKIDYAYSDMEFFNGVHRFSIGIDF